MPNLPPVPNTISNPIEKQFLERMRQSIEGLSTESEDISGGGPPYVSISGDTMVGPLVLDNLSGNSDNLLAVDATGEIKISGKVANDISSNTSLIDGNTSRIEALEAFGDNGYTNTKLVLYIASLAERSSIVGSPPTSIIYSDYEGITAHSKAVTYTSGQPTLVVETFEYNGDTWTTTKTITYSSGVPTNTTFDVTIT